MNKKNIYFLLFFALFSCHTNTIDKLTKIKKSYDTCIEQARAHAENKDIETVKCLELYAESLEATAANKNIENEILRPVAVFGLLLFAYLFT